MLRESGAKEVCAAITILLVVSPTQVLVPPFVGAITVLLSVVLVAELIDTSGYLYRLRPITGGTRG